MSYLTDRRRFLKSTALTGVGVFVAGTAAAEDSKSPNERIRFACIGVGGKGSSDSHDAKPIWRRRGHLRHRRQHAGAKPAPRPSPSEASTTTSARCSTRSARTSTRSPSARPTTCTPRPRPMAMRMGKACFTQKPLTHTDLRSPQAGRDRPRDEGRHADGQPGHGQQLAPQDGRDRPQAGAVGKVKEVHVWTNRPIWPQGGERPPEAAGAAERPLGPVDRPGADASLRRRLSSVHLARLLGLRHRRAGRHGLPHGQHAVHGARSSRSDRRAGQTSGHNKDSFPSGRSSRTSSPPTAIARPCKMVWYDGGKKPSADLFDGQEVSETGVLLIGDKGKLFAPATTAKRAIR